MPKLVMRFILIIVFFYSICSFGQSSSNMSWTKNVAQENSLHLKLFSGFLKFLMLHLMIV